MNKLDYLRMRSELRAYLIARAPNLRIDHNFGGLYQAATACDRMRWFYCAIQEKTFGRNWAKQYDRPWPVAYGSREHPNSNPHYHLVVNACPILTAAIIKEGPELWLEKVPHGQLYVQHIAPGDDGPVIYRTKHLTHAQAWEDLFVYSDTRGR